MEQNLLVIYNKFKTTAANLHTYSGTKIIQSNGQSAFNGKKL